MDSSRMANSAKNAVYTILNRIVIFLLTFLNRTLFIKYIGIEYFGIDGLFSNIINVLSMADLGLGIAMSYTLYKPLAENDQTRLAALMGFYKKVYNIIAFFIAVIGSALIPFLKYIVNIDREIPYLELIYFIVLMNTVISYLWVYKAAIITADQKGYTATKYNIIFNFLKSIVQCIVIVIFRNYILYLLIGVVFSLFYNLYVSYVADKIYPFIRQKVKLQKDECKAIFNNVKATFIYKISSTIVGGIDNIVISIVVGTVAVGYYSNYYMLMFWATQLVVLILNSIIPSVGNVIAKDTSEVRYKVFSTMQMICFWVYSIIIVCFFNVAGEFIEVWLGKEFVLSQAVLVAICLDNYIMGAIRPLWTYRDATGLYQKTKYIMLMSALVNLVLSFVLGNLIGLSGIIFATVLSRFVHFFYEPVLLFKMYFDRSSRNFFAEFFFNVALTSVLCLAVKYLFSFVELNAILSIILKLIVCFILVNVVYYIQYRNSSSFQYLVDKYTNILENIKHKIRRLYGHE